MATGRGRRPEVVTRCLNCGDRLVIIGSSGEMEVLCKRQRCRKAGISTPIRPIGYIRLPEGMAPDRGMDILGAVQSGRIPASILEQYLDPLADYHPLADYRQIKRLIVIGPAELDQACRSKNPDNPNPLGLEAGWIPRIEIPSRLDAWIRSLIWRDHAEWQTQAALVLTPPKIAGIPTSLIGQNEIWGVSHDGIRPGRIRQDIFWTNWFVKPHYTWANNQAVTEWGWQFVYEHPLWTTRKRWETQQKTAEERGMEIATVAADAFALNVVLAATGIRLRRASTWSRTSTSFDGSPLHVYSIPDGVAVAPHGCHWSARGGIAASVQGVPCDFEL